jgi:hypothetical protein
MAEAEALECREHSLRSGPSQSLVLYIWENRGAQVLLAHRLLVEATAIDSVAENSTSSPR